MLDPSRTVIPVHTFMAHGPWSFMFMLEVFLGSAKHSAIVNHVSETTCYGISRLSGSCFGGTNMSNSMKLSYENQKLFNLMTLNKHYALHGTQPLGGPTDVGVHRRLQALSPQPAGDQVWPHLITAKWLGTERNRATWP